MITGQEVNIEARLRALLGELMPPGWTWELAVLPTQAIDALFVATDPRGVQYPVFVEFKAVVTPADVPRLMSQYAGQKAVVAANEVSPRSRDELQKAGWSWVDLDGKEALLAIGGLSIDRQTPGPRRRRGPSSAEPVKNLFSGAAVRVIRWLLIEPRRKWTVNDMSRQARASASFVSRVFTSLNSQGWVERRVGRYGHTRVVDAERMLLEWAVSAPPQVEVAQRVSLISSPRERSMAVAEVAATMQYALTGEAAAEFVSPFTRYSVVDVYVTELPFWDKALSLTDVDRGGNVRLLQAPDEGVFDGAEPGAPGQPTIVSLPQLYVDLARAGGAAKDAAEFLLEQKGTWRE